MPVGRMRPEPRQTSVAAESRLILKSQQLLLRIANAKLEGTYCGWIEARTLDIASLAHAVNVRWSPGTLIIEGITAVSCRDHVGRTLLKARGRVEEVEFVLRIRQVVGVVVVQRIRSRRHRRVRRVQKGEIVIIA